MQGGRKIAVDAVAQTALFAHLVRQPGGEAATAQDVVAQQQREKVRVIALVSRLAHEHMGLRRIERQAQVLRCLELRHLGHGGQRLAAALRPPGQQAGDKGIGLGACHVAHHADHRTAGAQRLCMPALKVGHADALQTFGGGAPAVGMVAVDGLGKTVLRHGSGTRERLADGRCHLVAVALPHLLRVGRVCHLACGQLHRLVQQVGIAEAAQREAQAVTAGRSGKARPEVGPGFAELVFVQCPGVGSVPAGLRTHATGQLSGGGSRQAGLAGRVAAAAGVQIDLHIHHRDVVALDQVDTGPAGLLPVLDGQDGMGRIDAAQQTGQDSGGHAQKFHRFHLQGSRFSGVRRARGDGPGP